LKSGRAFCAYPSGFEADYASNQYRHHNEQMDYEHDEEGKVTPASVLDKFCVGMKDLLQKNRISYHDKRTGEGKVVPPAQKSAFVIGTLSRVGI